jgi:uncharacterized protein (TIGR02145 family)
MQRIDIKMKNRTIVYLLSVFMLSLPVCKKDNDHVYNLDPWVEYGSVSDIDGNTYKTILIGAQTWMVRNLKTTKYNDGTPVAVVNDASFWSGLSTPACCWLNNDPIRKVTYGVLYNWYAVNTGKLCPAGWHVPDDAEWTRLTDYLGGVNIAGGKLKESGFSHWFSPNTGATNETHFFALPGGLRLDDPVASFEDLGEAGYWWSMTSGENWGAIRSLKYNNYRMERLFYPKSRGLSVRCVSDY